ncbi:hypothetical protein G2W53_028598 [Senna tora]|uniref:Uncharacterized protein n=1 Tax=Senna tora TaxID=362788 RepID=A0A834T2M2_9FABA|nr:hypothetical protein G2W53_028598 [Senna tora]
MNLTKSFFIFSPNMPHALKRSVANMFGKYLGTWIDQHKSKDIFEDLVTKVQGRLQNWKSKCFSQAAMIHTAKLTTTTCGIFELWRIGIRHTSSQQALMWIYSQYSSLKEAFHLFPNENSCVNPARNYHREVPTAMFGSFIDNGREWSLMEKSGEKRSGMECMDKIVV